MVTECLLRATRSAHPRVAAWVDHCHSRGWPEQRPTLRTTSRRGSPFAIDLRERQPTMAPVVVFGSVVVLVLALSAVHAIWGVWGIGFH